MSVKENKEKGLSKTYSLKKFPVIGYLTIGFWSIVVVI